MDLFDYMRSNTMEKEAPLASSSVRPHWMRWLDRNILSGKDKLLYRAIKGG